MGADRRGARGRLLQPNGHLSIFTPHTLTRFCDKAGLTVVRTETRGVRVAEREGLMQGLEKAVLSLACRFTCKGDRLIVLACRPA